MSLTSQQQRAVEHRGSSVVLASGAGCGKTHVLTARYLSHLTADAAAVPQVVAITFTERERGASKMSNAIVAEALWKVTQWGVERRWRRLRRRGAPVGSGR